MAEKYVNQPTTMPNRKVTFATIGTSVGTVFYQILSSKFPQIFSGLEIEVAIQSLIIALFTLAAGYFVKENRENMIIVDEQNDG